MTEVEEYQDFLKQMHGPRLNIFRMTREERTRIMDTNPPVIDSVFRAEAYFDWSWKSCGYGQLSFFKDAETGKLMCSNECMSRDRVRQILHAFADHLADNVILEDGEP